MGKSTVLDIIITQISIFMRVNLGMIRRVVKGLSTIIIAISIQENG